MSDWEGNAALRPLLAPIDSLHQHPSNPRQGDMDAIKASLTRFGQQRPILALRDGTIVAGHHVWRAARIFGWDQIAVVRSDLTDEEVEGYLLADFGYVWSDLLFDYQATDELADPVRW